MSSIDEVTKELLENNPILLDEEFNRRYPSIGDVSSFLDDFAKTQIKLAGRYDFFDRMGVDSIGGYLEKLNKNDERAIKSYERLKKNLGF